jgi:hypothetical protein
MSKYRFGCGKEIEVFVPRGFSYVSIMRECGSTAHDGGINQCERCEARAYSMPGEDESDMDWYERELRDI